MAKKRSEAEARQKLRRKIESYLSEGRQCSQCVLLAVQEVVGVHDELLTSASRTLGRGMGGSGGTCGVLIAGMLALGLGHHNAPGDSDIIEGVPVRYGYSVAPRNDFLNTYTPIEPSVFAQCRELAARFGKETARFGKGALPTAGSLNCQDISAVDWSRPTREELARYYAPGGGMFQCVHLMTRTAEIVTELVQTHSLRAS